MNKFDGEHHQPLPNAIPRLDQRLQAVNALYHKAHYLCCNYKDNVRIALRSGRGMRMLAGKFLLLLLMYIVK